jgi:hypothetical protein
MTDQIKEDMERDEKVAKGIMTREQAEAESERWQQVSHSYQCQQRNVRAVMDGFYTVAEIRIGYTGLGHCVLWKDEDLYL